MNDAIVWLSASLACLLSLSLLSVAACLFLIRRGNRPSRSEHLNEQRLIQLSLDFRRLEQRVRELEGRPRETSSTAIAGNPDSGEREVAPSLISVPDMTLQTVGESDDAAPPTQKHENILTMAERGVGAAEIARATGRPIGQVELIVRLHRRQYAAKNAGKHAEAT